MVAWLFHYNFHSQELWGFYIYKYNIGNSPFTLDTEFEAIVA